MTTRTRAGRPGVQTLGLMGHGLTRCSLSPVFVIERTLYLAWSLHSGWSRAASGPLPHAALTPPLSLVSVPRWRKIKTGTAAAGVRLLGFVWKLFSGSYVRTRECVAVYHWQGP